MPEWGRKSYPFLVKENCKAIQLILQRDPSSKFDNLIKGFLWLDAISIHAEPGPATAADAAARH